LRVDKHTPAGRWEGIISLHQGIDHFVYGLDIELRQQAVNRVKTVIARNTASQWRTDHTAQQLGNVGAINRRSERHHHLSTRAIPTSADRVLRYQYAYPCRFLHAL